jgi:hypothetical protein
VVIDAEIANDFQNAQGAFAKVIGLAVFTDPLLQWNWLWVEG